MKGSYAVLSMAVQAGEHGMEAGVSADELACYGCCERLGTSAYLVVLGGMGEALLASWEAEGKQQGGPREANGQECVE